MRLNNLKIKYKLIVIYIICVMLPLFATNKVILNTIKQSVDKEQMEEIEDISSRIEYEISEKINNVVTISDYLYSDEKLNDFLVKRYVSPSDYYDSFNRLMKENVIRYYYTAQSVYNILVGMDNETITNGTYFIKKDEIRDTTWYRMYESSGKQILLYTYFDEKDMYAQYIERSRHISIIRRMDYYGRRDIIKLDINYNDLVQNIKNNYLDADVYICDNDKIIYSSLEKETGAQDFLSISEIKKKEVEYTRSITKLGGKWDIYITADGYSLISALKGKLSAIIILYVINMLLPSTIIVLINRSFRNRIALTQQYIKKMENGNYEEIICQEGKDEIGHLIRSYNLMVVKIKELIEVVFKKNVEQQAMAISKKAAELNALQSQVNPHFMFNALESIRMHSLVKNESETAVILGKFANLMRKVIQWDQDFVTIAEETENVKNYLDIQKYRFGDRLSYSVYVQEECMERKIPKFGIMNFVENACVHGIEKSISGGFITVMVSKDEENVFFEITDSGNGMSEQELQQLQKRVKEASIEDLNNAKSIGILNTIIRLKLYYDGNVKIDISSKCEEGTEICVTLPLVYKHDL